MMKSRLSANEYRTTMVCVDSYEQGRLSGRIFNPYIRGGESFDCLMNLLLRLDSLLDDMNFPQCFEAKRSFAQADPPREMGEVDATPRGRCATFAVRVLFRQNASWQGSVTWVEGNMEESFRSALELIFLMRGALESK